MITRETLRRLLNKVLRLQPSLPLTPWQTAPTINACQRRFRRSVWFCRKSRIIAFSDV